MRVKKLSKDIQSLFCSSVHLTSYKKAVEELVYNSIDANASAIAVRVNLLDSTIQVIDNGCGIHKINYDLLGQSHATSKYVDLSTFKSAPNTYGYRGQSLANIIFISKLVKITSRTENKDETWVKSFYKGKETNIKKTSCRPCKGTTVEVKGFLYNLSIQRQNVHVALELQDIKTFLKQVTLIHTNISLSLRDDNKNEILLKMHKNRDVYHKFQLLFNIEKSELIELKVEKNEYKASVFISTKSDLHHHWIFLNNRLISNLKLHKRIQDLFSKIEPTHGNKYIKFRDIRNGDDQPKYNVPFYIIFLTCPYYDYDLISKGNQSVLEFKDWTPINKLLEKIVMFYSGDLKLLEDKTSNLKQYDSKLSPNLKEEVKSIMDKILGNNSKKIEVKQMQKGVNGNKKGKPIKRKNKKFQNIKSTKLSSKKIKKVLTHQAISSIKNNKDVNTIKVSKNKLRSSAIYPRSKNLTNQITSNGSRALQTFDKLGFQDKSVNYETEQIRNHNKNKLQTPIKKRCIQSKKSTRNSVKNAICEQIAIKDQRQKWHHNYNKLHTPRKNNHEYSALRRCNRIQKSKFHCVKRAICDCAMITKNFHRKLATKHIIPLPTKQNYDDNISFLKSRDLLKTVLKTPLNVLNHTQNIKINTEEKKCSILSSIGNDHYLTYYSHKYCDRTDKINYKKPFKMREGSMEIHEALKSHLGANNRLNHFISKQSIENFSKLKNYEICKNNKTGSFKTTYNQVLEDDIPARDSENVGLIYTAVTSSNVTMNVTNHIMRHYENNKIYDDTFDNKRSKDFFNTDINIKNTKVVFISNSPNPKKITINNTLTADSLIIFDGANDERDEKDITVLDVSNCDFTIKQSRHHTKENNYEIHSPSTTSRNLQKRSLSVPCARMEFEDQHQKRTNAVVTNALELTFTKDILPWEICETVFTLNTQPEKSNYNNSLQENYGNIGVADQLNPKASMFQLNKSYQKDNIYKENESINNVMSTDEFERELHDMSFFNKAAFNFKQRLRFLPKGMSPIFEHCNTKSFGNYTSENEYFHKNVYNDFIDHVQATTEVYEAKVQNATKTATKDIEKFNHKLNKEVSSLTFSAESLKKTTILSQVDNKFIATILKGNSDQLNYLVLFDQHAVHERIRLEDNLRDYFNGTAWKSVQLDDICIKVTEDDVMYLHNYKEKFALLGLQWSVSNKTEITVHAIPVAIVGKHSRDVEKIFTAVKNLIFEEMNMMKTQKCVSLYPKSIMDLVFSEACRHAIKFGDKLSKENCMELIDSLSACKTPFQCAHGRPVMAVITNLTSESRQYKINQAKLLTFKEKIRNKTWNH